MFDTLLPSIHDYLLDYPARVLVFLNLDQGWWSVRNEGLQVWIRVKTNSSSKRGREEVNKGERKQTFSFSFFSFFFLAYDEGSNQDE